MSKAEALLKVLVISLSHSAPPSPVNIFQLVSQVILSPIDSVGDTYRALLPEGTLSEFQRILDLKVKLYHPDTILLLHSSCKYVKCLTLNSSEHFQGLKKADQQTILDEFNKHNTGKMQSPIATPVATPTPFSPPVLANTTSSSLIGIASREDVLTRAAALGRGAATTGFKRFLALTEAAKDRKDGPFRNFFTS